MWHKLPGTPTDPRGGKTHSPGLRRSIGRGPGATTLTTGRRDATKGRRLPRHLVQQGSPLTRPPSATTLGLAHPALGQRWQASPQCHTGYGLPMPPWCTGCAAAVHQQHYRSRHILPNASWAHVDDHSTQVPLRGGSGGDRNPRHLSPKGNRMFLCYPPPLLLRRSGGGQPTTAAESAQKSSSTEPPLKDREGGVQRHIFRLPPT